MSDEAFSIAQNPKYDGYQHGLASMVYKFFDKKTFGSGIKNENISNKELAEELHKHKPNFECVNDIFSKYAWVIPIKNKKGITITNAFRNILDESNRKDMGRQSQ